MGGAGPVISLNVPIFFDLVFIFIFILIICIYDLIFLSVSDYSLDFILRFLFA
jgi:hypothetical protein